MNQPVLSASQRGWVVDNPSWKEVSLLQWKLEDYFQQGGVRGQRRRGKVGQNRDP